MCIVVGDDDTRPLPQAPYGPCRARTSRRGDTRTPMQAERKPAEGALRPEDYTPVKFSVDRGASPLD